MIIDCDLEIRKVNEDGSLSDPIEVDTDEDEDDVVEEPPKLEAGAKWPFDSSQKTEGEK